MDRETITYWAKTGFIFMVVIALGITAINQWMGYYYKAQLLGGPCDLCANLNPHLKNCFIQESTRYVDKEGNIINKSEFKPIKTPFELNWSSLEINQTG